MSIATPSPTPSGMTTELDPSRVTPGILGLASLLLLALAVFLLWRSMNKQLKRVDFPEPEPEPRRRRAPGPRPGPGGPGATPDPAPGRAASSDDAGS